MLVLINISLDTLYNLIYVPALVLAIVAGLKTRYKYKVSRSRCLVYLVLSLAYAFATAEFSGKIYNAILLRARGVVVHQNRAIFGAILLTPPLIIATVLFEKCIRKWIKKIKDSRTKTDLQLNQANDTCEHIISVRNIMDMVTPIFLIVLIFVNVRCAWVGCCYGIPSSWGLYSYYAKTTTLPVQFFEAGCTFLILISCYFLKQKSFFRRGMAFPLAVSFYCAARFVLEFLRYYSPEERNFFLHLTLWQWLCIFVLISCVISIYVLYKTQPSDPLPGKLRPVFEAREQKKKERPRRQTVSQKRYSKQWQSTKKKYKKKKKRKQ